MSEIIRNKYVCFGCGDNRPCYVEANQQKSIHPQIEDLKCILDETNQTSYNWRECYSESKSDKLKADNERLIKHNNELQSSESYNINKIIELENELLNNKE